MNENNAELTLPSEKTIKSVQLPETPKKAEQKNPLSAYIGSEYLSMLENQEKEGRISAALFTDIDNTFFRKDRATSSKKLFTDLHQENYPVIAVTGNNHSTVEKRIQSGELPYFPIIAGAVGTEIYVLHEENGKKVYKKDEAYEELLRTKGYNRPELAKTGQQLIADLGGKNPEYKESHPEWRIDFQHPEDEQKYKEGKAVPETPFTMSFYAFAASDESVKTLRTEVSKRFSQERVVMCEEIGYNSQMQAGDTNKKYCIDILPTTKAGVIDYIADKTGVGFKVVAGDSGNDLEMLMESNTGVSVSVGGAKPEVLKVVDQNILNNEINKDIKEIRDNNGNIQKIYYREIGTGRGPESIAKIFKDVKIMQKASTPAMLEKEEGRKKFLELLKKGRSRQES